MLNTIAFTFGSICGVAWMIYKRGYLKTELEDLKNKTLLKYRTFQNRRIQPIETAGWNGGVKAFLAGIKTEPYWEETKFNPFGTR